MRAQEVNMIVNNIPDKWWIYLFSLNWNVKATFSYSPKHFHMKWITWVWLNMALRAEYCTNTMIQNNSDYCVCIECVLYNTRMTLDKHWHRFWQFPYLNWVTYSGLNNYKAHTDEEICFMMYSTHIEVMSNDLLLEWCSERLAVTPLGVCPALWHIHCKHRNTLTAGEH